MAAQLKDIEWQILKLLSELQGNIVDDENLINTLAQSKVTSNEIEVKAAEAAETEVVIDKTREDYRPPAALQVEKFHMRLRGGGPTGPRVRITP